MEKIKNNKINIIINNFIKEIIELDKLNNTLENKINIIDNLLDNLIDFCIKKKIFYYIENKISYNNIIKNFKSYLFNYIKKLIDPNNKIITKYILNETTNNSWDNYSDINSLMLRNFKNLNETFEKNVSFKDEYNTSDCISNNNELLINNNELLINNDSEIKINKNDSLNINDKNIENLDNEFIYLSLYIKILINQNNFLVELTDKLNYMCNILSNNDIKYNKLDPFISFDN